MHHSGWTSKVDAGITGSWLRWSTLTLRVTPQSANWVSTSLGNSGLCLTVFAQNRDTAVPAERNGDLQTLICVLVVRPRLCPTLSNPVLWQNWMAAYLWYTLQIKTLFHGWTIMVHDTHTKRRSLIWPQDEIYRVETTVWTRQENTFNRQRLYLASSMREKKTSSIQCCFTESRKLNWV